MAIFKVPMKAVSASAQQDLWHVKAGSTRSIVLREVRLSQRGLAVVESWDIAFRRHTVTVTQGSGGSTPTPVNVRPGGPSSGATVHMNDTTKASAGTLTDIDADVFHVLNGFFWLPPPEIDITIDPSTGIVVVLNTTPSGAVNLSGCLTFEEIGL